MAETINLLTEVDTWPTRRLPQQQFDAGVKRSMDQMSDMTEKLNSDFIPKVNKIHAGMEASEANARASELKAAASEANAKLSEQKANTSEGIATASANRASASAIQAANSSAQASIDAKTAKAAAQSAVAAANVEIATKDKAGLVKPDNKTLTVEEDGTLVVIGGAGGKGLVADPVVAGFGPSNSNISPLVFTVSSSSNLVVPRKIKSFVYSVPELGIMEREVTATNNEAQISLDYGNKAAVGTTLTLEIMAIDSEAANSNIITLTTVIRSEMITAPVMALPVSGGQMARSNIIMATSAFLVQSFGSGAATPDTHTRSQWRIRDMDNAIVYDSGESASLTRITITNPPETIVADREYWFEARHKGERLGWSSWSEPVKAKILSREPFSRKMEFLDPGNFVFSVPADVTQVRVLVVGGGGIGEDGQPGQAAGTVPYVSGVADHLQNGKEGGAGGKGGKGGGIVSAIINVVPGASIPIKVGGLAQSSSFGSYLQASAGSTTARGGAVANLGSSDELICNLASTPAGKYCRALADMSQNIWHSELIITAPDYIASIGGDGEAGDPTVSSALATGGSLPSGSNGGAGGNGGASTGWSTTKVGKAGNGGNGGNGANNGGNGGAGGDGLSGATAGNGGKGGNGENNGGNGGAGGNAQAANVSSYCRGGIGGNGGTGGTGKGNRGGNGGAGGTGNTYLYRLYGATKRNIGGNGGNGGVGLITGGNGGNGGNDATSPDGNPYDTGITTGGNGGDGGNGGSQGGNGGSGGIGGASGTASGYRHGGNGGKGGQGAKGGDGGNGGRGGWVARYRAAPGMGGDGGDGGDGFLYGGCGGNGGMGGRGGNDTTTERVYASGKPGLSGKGGDGGIGGDGGDGGKGGYSGWGRKSCSAGGTGGKGGNGGKGCVAIYY